LTQIFGFVMVSFFRMTGGSSGGVGRSLFHVLNWGLTMVTRKWCYVKGFHWLDGFSGGVYGEQQTIDNWIR